MTDAGYVIGGWSLTGLVIAGYVGRLWARTRRARRFLPPDEPASRGAGELASGEAGEAPQ
jgi:hypothetical protein